MEMSEILRNPARRPVAENLNLLVAVLAIMWLVTAIVGSLAVDDRFAPQRNEFFPWRSKRPV